MLHFLKYLLLAVFLFIFLNLFRSNLDVAVGLKFDVPLVATWVTPAISLNYLLIVAFCIGILFAAALGAFRFTDIRLQKRELKKMRAVTMEEHPKDELPSLREGSPFNP